MPGYKRKRNGDAWQLIVTVGSDFTGKPRRYTKTVHGTEKEAEKELSRFYVECETGSANTSNPVTVAELCISYMENYCKRYHKVSAQRSDRTAINNWIKPLLGKRKIAKLKKLEVQEWVNYITDQGKSPKTVRNYFSVFRSMMDFAIDMDIITHNPCENVRLPKKEKAAIKSYSKDELKMLIQALEITSEDELRYKCAILLALFGGFRKGEILGFDWPDVDFDTCTMHVRQTRMIGPQQGVYIDSPKTENSQRDVVVPPFIMDLLRKLKVQQKADKLKTGPLYNNSPAMIKASDGDPLYPQVLQRWFTSFCKRNDLPAYGLHALRHTHASLLANIGADKVLVSQRLGHSQLSTTLNIYTHLFENTDKTVASMLQEYADAMAK